MRISDWSSDVCASDLVGTTINVNTASPLLMHALTPNPGPELDQFLEERLKKPAENISELFNSRKVFGADAASTSLMGTSSEFFELRAEAYIGSAIGRASGRERVCQYV